MWTCRLAGHRYRFRAAGAVMTWTCQRGCGAGGSKTYASPRDAHRYAAAFDREDRDQLGRRAPWFSLFPLRAWRILSERLGRRGSDGTAPPPTSRASRGPGGR